MIDVWKHIRLWYYNKRYRRYDSRDINGIQVVSYWKLLKTKVGPGYVCIPMRLRVEDTILQSSMIYKSLRKAIELRIIKENHL